MDQTIPQQADGPFSDGVSVLAEGLLSLTPEERMELDKAVTPRVASLMAKAFGPDFHKLLRPLTENDGPDGTPMSDPRAGRNPDEEQLRQLMRDPRYWRDKDPAVLNKVSDGFRRLYG